jgi:hypothetical protein
MVAVLRPALSAALLFVAGSAFAGGAKPHTPPQYPPPPKPPVVRPAYPGVAVPVASPVVPGNPVTPAPQQVPVFAGFYPYPVIVAAPAIIGPVEAARAVRPLSVNVIDSRAVVARTPSGRVVIASAGGSRRGQHQAQAYAPPVFHMIGAPSAQHMGRPVHVVHGVKPLPNRPTEPRVIWLKEPREGRQPLKSGG